MESLNKNQARFSPLPLGHGLSLKNRVVVPPMASATAAPDGTVTGATLDHYARLAQSKAGLVIAEYTFVHTSGRSEEHQLGAASLAHLPGLSALAATIKAAGAAAGLQLTHSGGKSSRALTEGALMGPSAISVPVKGETLETPARMSGADIALWKNSFLHAIALAELAGFDLVELHSAHGYGLNQFLSPVTNQRAENYGGPLENRMRLLLEILTAALARHPRLRFSVRIPGQDFLPHGLSAEEGVALARALEKAGVHVIHVSSGIGGWRRPAPRTGEGYLVEEATRIAKAVSVPVIGVGGIETAAYIEESLALGRFGLAAVGRAILKAPREWGEQNLRKPQPKGTHENAPPALCPAV